MMREQKQQVQLPFKKAFEFAMNTIKIRFWRSMITAGGVFLGIAFLASVLTSRSIGFGNLSPERLVEQTARSTWLAGLSLLVCAVGITNAMLMSVTERFREIGTMKCLGALEQFVVKIFLIEAALMGFIASFVGYLIGFLMMYAMKYFSFNPKTALPGDAWNGAYTIGAFFTNLVFCVGIGVALTMIATLFPAKKASSIPPAAALRSDV
jgi:putative ABC transport system permease protein